MSNLRKGNASVNGYNQSADSSALHRALRQHLFNDVAVDVGEAEVAALEAVG
jgi:hypothetical protein